MAKFYVARRVDGKEWKGAKIPVAQRTSLR